MPKGFVSGNIASTLTNIYCISDIHLIEKKIYKETIPLVYCLVRIIDDNGILLVFINVLISIYLLEWLIYGEVNYLLS